MKHILSVITICIMLIMSISSCKTNKDITESFGTYVTPTSVHAMKPDTFNIEQMDSVIIRDRLPLLKDWKNSSFKEDESNQTAVYKLIYNHRNKTIYTVKIMNKTTYILMKKRISE